MNERAWPHMLRPDKPDKWGASGQRNPEILGRLSVPERLRH